MVSANQRRRQMGQGDLVGIRRVVIGVSIVLVLGSWYSIFATTFASLPHAAMAPVHKQPPTKRIAKFHNKKLLDIETIENAVQIKQWRKTVVDKCAAAQTQSEVMAIRTINKYGFSFPTSRSKQPRDPQAIRRCKNVLLDFGANIGDTSGKLMDAGFVGCDRNKDLNANVEPPAYSIETKKWEDSTPKHRNKQNPLTKQFVQLMSTFNSSLMGPEDYCYYGVEGNPVFTSRLQELEDYVMGIRPRPLQHIHFFTESVGTGQDGMTKLYLDTINPEHNFWGSSIMKSHQDVRKSANGTDTVAAADVMGYTIGTLMRQTLSAFDPDATPQEKRGGHLILKIDIEGGEYPLLHEAAEEGTLCEYVKKGNRVDLYVEYHSKRVTGPHDFEKDTHKKKLEACGVKFRNLAAWWA